MTPELLALLTPEQVGEIRNFYAISSGLRGAADVNALLSDRAEIAAENAELKKLAAGLELNLAAVIQRAEAAEKALAEAKFRLLDAQAARTIWMERSKANARELDEAYDAMCEMAKTLDCAEDWAAIKGKLAEAAEGTADLNWLLENAATGFFVMSNSGKFAGYERNRRVTEWVDTQRAAIRAAREKKQ